jgi:agmatinase
MIPYGDLPHPFCDREYSGIVILPVPYDATSTWIKGADRGPLALLEASANMELYDIETDTEVFRKGIHTDQPLNVPDDPSEMVSAVNRRVLYWLEEKKMVVTLGGEHSISLGAVLAHNSLYPGMSVLQLDAHTDLRPEYEGSPYNHACVMARIQEHCPVTQVGIRSMDVAEKAFIQADRFFPMEHLRNETDWMEHVVDTLNREVYITLDLDVLDPSIMPSTGTPEPGGMDWYTLLSLLRKVAENRTIIGFDVVELCPVESNKAPDFLAAKLLYKILSYIYQ